jgi:outer membrane receptor protein involved in Fe transport
MRIRIGLLAGATLAVYAVIGDITRAEPTTNPSTSSSMTLPEPPPMIPPPTAIEPATQPAAPAIEKLPPAPPAVARPPQPPPQPRTTPTSQPSVSSVKSTSPTAARLGTVVVKSNLDANRDQITPSLGATTYTIGPDQIQSIPQGESAPFQQVLLRAPGVVEDQFGQEHVRGEHANTTYAVNGVLLPQPITLFGQELDTHLIQSVTLTDGSLPAQYGFHTAGIIDVTTKTGESLNSNEVSMYGGSNELFNSSFSLGGTSGKWDYFVTGSYKHDDLGLDNTTSSPTAIHDEASESRLFTYLSYHIDDTSRVTLLLNGAYSNFEIPNTAGLPQQFALSGVPFADSRNINENQNEQEYYSVLAYQKTIDKLSFQLSGFYRYAEIHYKPDPVNDLIFQGVASDIDYPFTTAGTQFDASYILNDQHTIRAGYIADYTWEQGNTTTAVFNTNPDGTQASDVPVTITDDTTNHALETGLYAQDEWRLTPALTLNYGLRYDIFDANFDSEGQLSPRANLVWKINNTTTAHVGYARYFVTPPGQYVPPSSLAKFANTTNAPLNTLDDPPKVERSNYYDVGISKQITQPWQVNVDGFYKQAKNLIDQGQFGPEPILSTFNYADGYVFGAELSSTYKQGPWSLFGNFSWVKADGRNIDSQQFLIEPAELAFIKDHFIRLDHEGEFTGSGGVNYDITRNDSAYVDFLYGSGLRAGFANTLKEPQYYPINVGYMHVFHIANSRDLVKLRFDIINVFDEAYQIRSGSGVGVGAPSSGRRRTFGAGLAYDF